MYVSNTLASSQLEPRADKTRRKHPRHPILQLKLRPPPRAMPRQQQLRSQRRQILHRAPDDLGLRVRQMKPAYHGIQRLASGQLDRVSRRIHHPRVTAPREHHDAFPLQPA